MAITVTISNNGQVTMPTEVLAHTGVQPGDRIDVELLLDRIAMLRASVEPATQAEIREWRDEGRR